VIEYALEDLGFDQQRAEECVAKGLEGTLGRVSRVDRVALTALTSSGPERVETTAENEFVVGDWIIFDKQKVLRLDRRTELARQAGPRGSERQAVAANVDLVLITHSLTAPFRINLLSTFLVMAFDAGALPILVLTKRDLVEEAEALQTNYAERLGGIEAIVVSTATDQGVDPLRARISGHSVVFLGESGAGKSSLTNALCGSDFLVTGDISRSGQGKHTTTHRELIVLPTGGVVIDTPGVRDAASFDQGVGITLAFHDVIAAAEQCRFSDCSHEGTPGCAVDAALRDGLLIEERVEAYFAERDHLASLGDADSKPSRGSKGRRPRPPVEDDRFE
jgi:ribosome biogenesis GTPase